MVESERRPFRGGTRSESARPLLTKEPRGGTHWENPEALVWERDRFIHQDPIRGGQKSIRRVCEARGQIRVGPDHGPEPRVLRSLPSPGEVRAERILTRSLSVRGWEADR